MSRNLLHSVMAAAFLLTLLAACAPTPEPAFRPEVILPFSEETATVPDALDQRLIQHELWRTRLGLADCLNDARGPEAGAVNLVRLDMFISRYGAVDSVAVAGARLAGETEACLAGVVRTWLLSDEHDEERRYRFTLPLSSRITDMRVGGELGDGADDGRAMRAVTILMYRNRARLAECYLVAREVDVPTPRLDCGGMVVMRLRVDDEGKVTGARVMESTMPAGLLDSCLAEVTTRWKLPVDRETAFEFPVQVQGDCGTERVTRR